MRHSGKLLFSAIGILALSASAHAQGGVQGSYYFPPRQDRTMGQAAAEDMAQSNSMRAAAQGTVTVASVPATVTVAAAPTMQPAPAMEPVGTTNDPYYFPPQAAPKTPVVPPVTANTRVSPPLTQTARYYPPQVVQQAAAQGTPGYAPAMPSTKYVQRPYQASPTASQPVATELGPQTPSMTLDTRHGIELGIQGSYYRYRESSADVTELGGLLGFTAAATMVFPQSWFATLDGRYAFAPGGTNYHGSGTAKGDPTDLWEVRLTGGKDLHFEYFVLSPYAGLGYRELYNDARGVTSTGANGYRRLNQMAYAPMGLSSRWRVTDETRVTGKIEYDATLIGVQHSYVSDVSSSFADVLNRQGAGGSGVRAELMFETDSWSAGPFFNYWDIGQSNTSTQSGGVCTAFGTTSPCNIVEPRNHTTEGGIQVRYHLF